LLNGVISSADGCFSISTYLSTMWTRRQCGRSVCAVRRVRWSATGAQRLRTTSGEHLSERWDDESAAESTRHDGGTMTREHSDDSCWWWPIVTTNCSH